MGCGTGTLALKIQRRVGRAGHVTGVDPATQQIARARSKAARRHLPIEFQFGVIEQLPCPDQTFDVVFSTLMMHHLPAPLKRQGRATQFHAGGSRMHDLAAIVSEAGFDKMETEEMRPVRFSTFPGANILRAYKS